MLRPLVVAAACAALVVPFTPLAAELRAQEFAPIYGIRHSPPEIWQIDLATGKATFVTNHMTLTKVAAARHPRTGQVWVVSNFGINKISVWDPATDSETTINTGTNLQYHRMGFDADGVLYGVPLNSNQLYLIDTTTGNPTSLGGMLHVDSAGDGGDLAFPPGETKWFSYFAGSKYYIVDVKSVSGVFKRDVGIKMTGLAYTADGRLWATTDTDFYSVNPADGAITWIGTFGMKQILDITEDLSPLYFGASSNAPAAGSTLTLFARQGGAGQPVALLLTAVNAAPTFQVVQVGAFDVAGEWSLAGTVPPGLSGISLQFETIGFAPDGELLMTNAQTLTFP